MGFSARGLDLSAISDVVHSSCNHRFYEILLQALQKEATKIGIVFDQKKSNILFAELHGQIKIKLQIAITCSRIRYLNPKLNFDTALNWVLDDIDNGYGEKLLSEIFSAVSLEGVYIHCDNSYIFDPSFETEEFIKDKLNELGLYKL